MLRRRLPVIVVSSALASTLFVASLGVCGQAAAAAATSAAAPLSIGETWTIESAAPGERRRINVYLPAGLAPGTRLPVVYMPDGGMLEDFLHVAGLLQAAPAMAPRGLSCWSGSRTPSAGAT